MNNTYAEVNLAAIKNNIEILKKCAKTDVMAVVKADAYGHGMEAVSRCAYRNGVRWFAVATYEEAIELRNTLEDANILILSYPGDEGLDVLVEKNISFAAYRPEHIVQAGQACSRTGMKARIHIKIDTGMNRIGIKKEEELLEILGMFRDNPDLVFEGVFTHFASADEGDKSFTIKQFDSFRESLGIIHKEGFHPIAHAANSAATIEALGTHLDMCRMGISMYGYAPSNEVDIKGMGLEPALKWVSHVTNIKTIEPGETVSYGRHHTAGKRETILTVGIGYADGYFRIMSNKVKATVDGIVIRNVGNICMDQTMYLIEENEDSVRIGDEVVILGEKFNADYMAALAGTISYEILTHISKRVPRVYVYRK